MLKKQNFKTELLIGAQVLGLFTASIAMAADPACIKTVASFDVGSAETKMVVLKMDACKLRILEQLFPEKDNKAQKASAKKSLGFKRDLESTEDKAREEAAASGKAFPEDAYPMFSQSIIAEASVAFADLKKLAQPYHPSMYVAVATQAFREAKNADYVVDYVLKKLDIKALVPSQKQEALIEFMAAKAGIRDFANIADTELLTWGIGGGSMQMGAKDKNGQFIAFASLLASDSMYDKAVAEIKGSGSLLPVTRAQIDQMIATAREEANQAPAEIKNKFGFMPKVVGVGGVMNQTVKNFLAAKGINRIFFTAQDLDRLLTDLAGKEGSDPIFASTPEKYRDQVVSNIALVYGVMDALAIDRVLYSDVNNAMAAPIIAQQGIRMSPPKKAVVRVARSSPASKSAAQTAPHKVVIPRAAEDAILSDDSSSWGADGTDFNLEMCTNQPKYQLKGKICTVIDPCLDPMYKDRCTGGISGTQCTVKGKTTLIWNLCTQ